MCNGCGIDGVGSPRGSRTLSAITDLVGFQSKVFRSGRAALAAHRKRPADLLVTDIFMPEVDGLGVISEFRRVAPDVPIIAVSGGPSSMAARDIDYPEMARLLGARRFLANPVRAATLRAALLDCATAVAQPRGTATSQGRLPPACPRRGEVGAVGGRKRERLCPTFLGTKGMVGHICEKIQLIQ